MSHPGADEPTVRLTVAQAVVRFLAQQWSERDGARQRLFAGCLGIFGHGNVAGLGQALLEQHYLAGSADQNARRPSLRYVLARNEQAMVHTAVGYARQCDRLQTWACTASVGPGSTNMLTGAALATISRLPVLLLPSDTFATRRTAPVLQELELAEAGDLSVNDAFRPLSRYFDRVTRAEQLPAALLSAMRVLTDPAQTGAVTLALPQDVQAEAALWPSDLFHERTWRVPRPPAESSRLETAAQLIRQAHRPLIVAGGGVRYSAAQEALAAWCTATGIPVGETQAGKGSLLHGHPQAMGGIGVTGTTAANALAAQADVVIGIGTRWSDFTTASRSAFADPGVTFVNINIAAMDAGKQSGLAVVADAREAITALHRHLGTWTVDPAYREHQQRLVQQWQTVRDQACRPPAAAEDSAPGLLTQANVLGILNDLSAPSDVVVCAAGSMPGDLHKLWQVRESRSYHVEYGYSCMGYEIPAALGVRLADPAREVFALVGDGGYLMMPGELVTAVQERVKIIVVLVDNQGFASIGALSQEVGSQRFGTQYRYRHDDPEQVPEAPGSEPAEALGAALPIDLAANARSLGVHVIEADSPEQLRQAVHAARERTEAQPVLIRVRTDPMVLGPDSRSWWDVPVSAVAALPSTQQAYQRYRQHQLGQRHYLRPTEAGAPPAREDR